MSKTEILAELPRLAPQELAEVQAKLDELAGESWLAGANLSDSERGLLDEALAEYLKEPDAGSSWEQAKARVLAGLGR